MRPGRVAVVVLLFVLLGLGAPAWAGGTDEPVVGSSTESMTVGSGGPEGPQGWDLFGWLCTIVRLAMGPLAA